MEIAIWKQHSRLTVSVLTVIRQVTGILVQLSEHAQKVVLLVIYKVTTGALLPLPRVETYNLQHDTTHVTINLVRYRLASEGDLLS